MPSVGAVAEAHAYAQQQEVVHADETGWWERHRRAWLWVLTTALVTVFMVHARRNTEAARALLGRHQCHLGHRSPRRVPPVGGRGQRQLCWAHLRRDFRAFTERGGEAARLGRALLRDTTRMFARVAPGARRHA